MNLTHHSEYGQLKTVYLQHITNGFISQEFISKQWNELNYIGEPQYDIALKEYAEFEALISSGGVDVSYFESYPSLSIDSIYCRDSSIVTDFGIILCNMGKEARKNEPQAVEASYQSHRQNILGKISSPGTVEGGDVCWIDKSTLAVGHSYRTNMEGINQLKALLEPHGIRILIVDLPHYKGPSDVFHLMSILSPVDKDLMVVYSPLMPISFRNTLIDMGNSLIEVPEKEFDSMGCNVLAIAPRKCVMVDGNPISKLKLEEAGATVHTYQGLELSVKGGGGPTCLTRPLLREL